MMNVEMKAKFWNTSILDIQYSIFKAFPLEGFLHYIAAKNQ